MAILWPVKIHEVVELRYFAEEHPWTGEAVELPRLSTPVGLSKSVALACPVDPVKLAEVVQAVFYSE